MNTFQAIDIKVQQLDTPQTAKLVGEHALEEMVSTSLLDDLNGQLADISKGMQQGLQQKQALRGELEGIYSLRNSVTPQEIDGVKYVDLTADQAQLLGVTDKATPVESSDGKATLFRMTEEDFNASADAAVDLRKTKLEGLNSNNEVTMLKIQSLVDQRKNAMALLSNLFASASETARGIIANINK